MRFLLLLFSLIALQYVYCLDNKYDFIVIGGGTSGSVVASRLSESGKHSVLLLEAGVKDNDNPLIKDIGNFMDMENTHLRWGAHKLKDETTTSGMSEISVMRVLGGGSTGNGGGYERGDVNDWDAIADYLGDDSWRIESLIEYFEKVENAVGKDNDLGEGGVFTIDFGQEGPLSDAWKAAAEELGYPAHTDFSNRGKDSGFAFEGSANINGDRQHAANTYIEHVASKSLTILTEAQVSKIVMKQKGKKLEADAVEFYHDGQYHQVKAKNEIIVSAGAIYTPFLLKHSGIGYEENSPEQYIDLPGVGRNLIDNSGFVMLFTNNIETPEEVGNLVPVALINGTEDSRDTFIILKADPGIFVVVLVANQHGAKGSVSLYDKNPFSMPKIDYNFLENDDEIERMKGRIEAIRSVMNSDAMSQYEPFEILPGEGSDLEDFIRSNVYHSFHLVGTCKMGPDSDALAVVDNKFKVKGVDKLRVIDNSVIPIETKMGTMATALMLGEKGADTVLSQYSPKRADVAVLSLSAAVAALLF